MPRNNFSPWQILLEQTFDSPNNEIKLGLNRKQVKWQRCRWGYFTDMLLMKEGSLKFSKEAITEWWYYIYKRCPVNLIPKACLSIDPYSLNYHFSFNPNAQLHHINPKYYASIKGDVFDPDNNPNNIIPLEPWFHNGENYRGWLPSNFEDVHPFEMHKFPIVHPDFAISRMRARQVGWGQAIAEQDLYFQYCLDNSIPPYNDTWDLLFLQLTEESYWLFSNAFKIPYPDSTQDPIKPTFFSAPDYYLENC